MKLAALKSSPTSISVLYHAVMSCHVLSNLRQQNKWYVERLCSGKVRCIALVGWPKTSTNTKKPVDKYVIEQLYAYKGMNQQQIKFVNEHNYGYLCICSCWSWLVC